MVTKVRSKKVRRNYRRKYSRRISKKKVNTRRYKKIKYKIKSNKRTYKKISKRKGRGGGKIADMSNWEYIQQSVRKSTKSAIRATPKQEQFHMKKVDGTKSRFGDGETMDKVMGTLYRDDGTLADESSHDEGVIPVVNISNREGRNRMVGFADEYGGPLEDLRVRWAGPAHPLLEYEKELLDDMDKGRRKVVKMGVEEPVKNKWLIYDNFVCSELKRFDYLEKECMLSPKTKRDLFDFSRNASDSYKITFSEIKEYPINDHSKESKHFWIRWGDIQKIKKVNVYMLEPYVKHLHPLPKKTRGRKLIGRSFRNSTLKDNMSKWWEQFNWKQGLASDYTNIDHRIFPELVTLTFKNRNSKSLKEFVEGFITRTKTVTEEGKQMCTPLVKFQEQGELKPYQNMLRTTFAQPNNHHTH